LAIDDMDRSGSASSCTAYATFSGVIADGRPRRWPRAAARAFVRVRHDDRADELSQRREDTEHENPTGRGGVELLVQRLEPDTLALEPAHDADQILQGAAEPVERHHRQHVAGPDVVEHAGQLGPVGVLARRLVEEALRAPGRRQGGPLPGEVLLTGEDAAVADEHRRAGPGRAGRPRQWRG